MLRMSCPAALNQQNSTVFGPTLDRGRIDVPIAYISRKIDLHFQSYRAA